MSRDGLRAIWIATYAASWTAETERIRRCGGVAVDTTIAMRAVDEATAGALALRDAYLSDAIRGTERIAMVRDALGEDLVDQLDAARDRRSGARPADRSATAAPATVRSAEAFDVGLALELAVYMAEHGPDRVTLEHYWLAMATLRHACTEIRRLRAELAAKEVP